ncbi:MAG: class I SAM-dependent methyltransferase [Bacteroidetes bacterium]|nr:class I SAM-dependent methyltransferase [Bacteroidota bacterium]
MNSNEWFKTWFNSPYYHLLYNNRDYFEAEYFIKNIFLNLKLQTHSTVWDLACGNGRHALAINKLGFNVTGSDLSENSISDAKNFESKTLNYFVHDMRTKYKENYFNVVVNLFTSIGYFDDFNDNLLVFKNAYLALKPQGYFIVDFFNADFIVNNIKPTYEERRGDVCFLITKKIEQNKIIKNITFSDKLKNYSFKEAVSLLDYTTFLKLADNSGFKVVNCFGDYSLNTFNKNQSERLILVLQK